STGIAWRLGRQGRQFESGRPDIKDSESSGSFFVKCYYAYIFFSPTCNNYYTAHTRNLENRLYEHNSGEGNFTSICTPWASVWSTSCSSKGEFMKLENQLQKPTPFRYTTLF